MKRIFHKSFSGGAVAIVNATPFPRFSSNRRYNENAYPVEWCRGFWIFTSDKDENACSRQKNTQTTKGNSAEGFLKRKSLKSVKRQVHIKMKYETSYPIILATRRS
jgi:hypothetical protein